MRRAAPWRPSRRRHGLVPQVRLPLGLSPACLACVWCASVLSRAELDLAPSAHDGAEDKGMAQRAKNPKKKNKTTLLHAAKNKYGVSN